MTSRFDGYSCGTTKDQHAARSILDYQTDNCITESWVFLYSMTVYPRKQPSTGFMHLGLNCPRRLIMFQKLDLFFKLARRAATTLFSV